MKKTCLVVHGKRQDDVNLRPGTATPNNHWAYHLLDSFAQYDPQRRRIQYPEGAQIHWGDGQDEPISVRITAELWKNDEACFAHLMRFVRDNALTYEFPVNMQECDNCEGHPSCVANEHNLNATETGIGRSGVCQRAA